MNKQYLIKNLWFGRLRLWQVFWLVYVPFNLLLSLTLGSMGLADPEALSTQQSFVLVIFLGLASAFLSIVIWRNSANTSWLGWMLLARILAVTLLLTAMMATYVFLAIGRILLAA